MGISRSIFKIINQFINKRNIYLVNSLPYKHRRHPLPVNFDYVRHETLGLCFEELKAKQVKGNLAELGVYKGDFSKKINLLFPDRKLYLFDTFQGFDKKDVAKEQSNDYSTGTQDFSDTSVSLVMGKMKYPENCIVRQGFFPETANGLEDTFCFVSLDADLYDPILSGLGYFYPRLERGGYIFVHDFNNEEYKGAREAVVKFCKDNNIGYTPIPDIGGSVIITK
jgi:O-methyltransferase